MTRFSRTDLPSAVHDLAVRLGVSPDDDRDGVRLTQTGRMKTSLETDTWMDFTAIQTISNRTCEFDWRAKAGPFGLITARDALDHGEGRLDIMAAGVIPIARAEHTTALLRGELMRYLAELPWAPAAILLNNALGWRVEGPDSLAVSAGSGETTSEVIFSLDANGRVATAFAPDRPRSATLPILVTPWRGTFSDYRLQGTTWLPHKGEVAWEMPGQNGPYWQCRLDHWEPIDDPDQV